MRLHCASIATLAALVAGCGGESPPDDQARLGTTSSQLVSDNGRSLNGRSLNGRSLNGRSLSGAVLKGVKSTGVQLGGSPVSGLALTSSVFSGSVNGVVKRGAELVGSTWQGVLTDGSTIAVRVDVVAPLPAPNRDVLAYGVSYQTQEGWFPVCGYEPDGSEVLAIPMSGFWNYGQSILGAGGYDASAPGFTFACRHYAIGKCVEMGYKPWASVNGESLQPYMVSCVRALRADYCGTGVSYTVDGTLIDLADRAGIQAVAEPAWPIEAEWGPNGARCMAPASKDRFANTNQLLPLCYPVLWLTGCGSNFRQGTYIINRFQR